MKFLKTDWKILGQTIWDNLEEIVVYAVVLVVMAIVTAILAAIGVALGSEVEGFFAPLGWVLIVLLPTITVLLAAYAFWRLLRLQSVTTTTHYSGSHITRVERHRRHRNGRIEKLSDTGEAVSRQGLELIARRRQEQHGR